MFEGGLPKTFIGPIDAMLARTGSKILVPVMAFAVGVYLPFVRKKPIVVAGAMCEGFASPALAFAVVVMVLLYVLSRRKKRRRSNAARPSYTHIS